MSSKKVHKMARRATIQTKPYVQSPVRFSDKSRQSTFLLSWRQLITFQSISCHFDNFHCVLIALCIELNSIVRWYVELIKPPSNWQSISHEKQRTRRSLPRMHYISYLDCMYYYCFQQLSPDPTNSPTCEAHQSSHYLKEKALQCDFII